MGLVYLGAFIIGVILLGRLYDMFTAEKRLNNKIQDLETEKRQLKQDNNKMREVAVFRDYGNYDHFDRYRITHLNRDVDTERKDLAVARDGLENYDLSTEDRAALEYAEAEILKQIVDDKQKYKIFMLTNGKRK